MKHHILSLLKSVLNGIWEKLVRKFMFKFLYLNSEKKISSFNRLHAI